MRTKRKKLLITAGPTWVAIDKVRVVTTVFSGNLGVAIANEAYKKGYSVTLLYGPGRVVVPKERKNYQIIRFKYYTELLNLVKHLLSNTHFDAMVHSAAVADYQPTQVYKGKIRSGKRHLAIQMKPTIKIVNLVKKIDKNVYLVKFKLEVDKTDKQLRYIANHSIAESNADLIVANHFHEIGKEHRAFIIDKEGQSTQVHSKGSIAKHLVNIISRSLSK